MLALTGFVITSPNSRALRYRTDQSQTYHRDQPEGLGFDRDSAWVPRQVRIVFAVKLTRKPTAYADQRIPGIPLGECADHPCHRGMR